MNVVYNVGLGSRILNDVANSKIKSCDILFTGEKYIRACTYTYTYTYTYTLVKHKTEN